jgi:hypothetical protein
MGVAYLEINKLTFVYMKSTYQSVQMCIRYIEQNLA